MAKTANPIREKSERKQKLLANATTMDEKPLIFPDDWQLVGDESLPVELREIPAHGRMEGLDKELEYIETLRVASEHLAEAAYKPNDEHYSHLTSEPWLLTGDSVDTRTSSTHPVEFIERARHRLAMATKQFKTAAAQQQMLREREQKTVK